MNVAHAGAAALRRVLLGNTNLPQQCTVGISDPQTEVRVWLHGAAIVGYYARTPSSFVG